MYDYAKSLIALRKKWRFLHVYDPRVIAPMVDLSDEGAVLLIKIVDGNMTAPYDEIDFLLNPSSSSQTYAFSSDRVVLVDTSGDVSSSNLLVQNVLLPKHSVLVFGHLSKKA